jgi:hypothetical protein
MTTPERQSEQPTFETFTLGWRIPPAILKPLLHPAAPTERRDPRADTPASEPDAGQPN